MDHLRIGLIWRYSDPHCIKLFCSILQEKQYRFTTCFKTCWTGYKKSDQSIFLHSKIKLMCDSHFLPFKQTRLLNFVDYQQYFQNNASLKFGWQNLILIFACYLYLTPWTNSSRNWRDGSSLAPSALTSKKNIGLYLGMRKPNWQSSSTLPTHDPDQHPP